MKLSIVIPTVGRCTQVDALLASIDKYVKKECTEFEVVVVDQNFSDLLDDVVGKYVDKFPINHYKVFFRGVSKAKNFGTSKTSGEYICFTDDDAEFTEGLVKHVLEKFEDNSISVLSGRCIDREGNNSVLNFEGDETVLSLKKYANMFVESTMFFRRNICLNYPWDEDMGVGVFYGAEEAYDLVLRLLNDGMKIVYDPYIKFYHPQTNVNYTDPSVIRKTFSYKVGFGHLCRKHHLKKPYYKRLILVLLYIPYLCFVRRQHVRFYVAELLGMLVGKHL